MKLHPAKFAHRYIFTGYGDDYVSINQVHYKNSLMMLPDHLIDHWPVTSVSHLAIEHFEILLPHAPEIIILGTGKNHQFPPHSLLNQLAKIKIGVEIMDTRACCRTYNILVEEDRRVAAMVLIESV